MILILRLQSRYNTSSPNLTLDSKNPFYYQTDLITTELNLPAFLVVTRHLNSKICDSR